VSSRHRCISAAPSRKSLMSPSAPIAVHLAHHASDRGPRLSRERPQVSAPTRAGVAAAQRRQLILAHACPRCCASRPN
jgi:hypothetical protein